MRFSFLEKFGAAVLVTAWMVWGSSMIGNALVSFEEPRAAVPGAAAPPMTPSAVVAAPAEPADLGTLLALASAEAGEKIFKKCKACHTVGKGGPNRVGPNLWDIVGGGVAGRQGFRYSGALAGKGGQWTYEDLDRFLAKPKDFVPGTKMTFRGLKKAEQRAHVIAYIRTLSDSPKPLP